MDEITVEYMSEAGGLQLRHGYPTDCGWDMFVQKDCVIKSKQQVDVPTDLKINIPAGYHARILARSSTTKRGILVLPGIIDAGFQGQLYALCWNLLDDDVIVKQGDRIAQIIFYPLVPVKFVPVSAFSTSARGTKGFGSTGA
jgi:dUTP pyrophosphatase